jgi:hypothetical protein
MKGQTFWLLDIALLFSILFCAVILLRFCPSIYVSFVVMYRGVFGLKGVSDSVKTF